HEPGGESTYELGWCHGPAGTARLFHELGIVTGRSKWGDLANACAHSIAQAEGSGGDQGLGAPGVGDFLISVHEDSPPAAQTAAIARLATSLRDRAVADREGMRWPTAGTGYMNGAAGIGAFFLHCDTLAKNRSSSAVWPDSPWARPCAEARAKVSR